MKRIAALKALSTDHYHALVLARKARKAAAVEAATTSLNSDQHEIWSALLDHAKTVLEPHFEIEENCLAMALRALNEPQIDLLVNRLLTEHATLRFLLSPESAKNTVNLKQLGELLEQHIRFEERELFEVAQMKLSKKALEAIADACGTREK